MLGKLFRFQFVSVVMAEGLFRICHRGSLLHSTITSNSDYIFSGYN